MKTIGFIGLGLIGGSIAKAIRKYHEDYRILAYDQNRETLATAVSSNMIDAVCAPAAASYNQLHLRRSE